MEQLLLNHSIEFPHWLQCLYPPSAPCWVRNLLSSCICKWRSSSWCLSAWLSEQFVLGGWTCPQNKEMIPEFANHHITFPDPILYFVSIFWTPPSLWNCLGHLATPRQQQKTCQDARFPCTPSRSVRRCPRQTCHERGTSSESPLCGPAHYTSHHLVFLGTYR